MNDNWKVTINLKVVGILLLISVFAGLAGYGVAHYTDHNHLKIERLILFIFLIHYCYEYYKLKDEPVINRGIEPEHVILYRWQPPHGKAFDIDPEEMTIVSRPRS